MTIYSQFAVILDYPSRSISEAVGQCAAELAAGDPEAQAHLLRFQTELAGKALPRMQEAYIAAFDLRPDCTPNLSYHLFGDDARRGVFLAELKARMEARGMALGVELPDHLSFILEYLDLAEEERPVLIEDCLLPALTRMIEVLNNSGNPYRHALCALASMLRCQCDALGTPAETMNA